MFFTLYPGVTPPIYFLLQVLSWWRYGISMVEEDLLSKSASVTMKQTSHPVQSKKVKRRKVKRVIVHYEKLYTSQIGFSSIRIWTLNTLSFHRLISEIAIRKDFQLKFFHKKAFLLKFDKIKKILFVHRLFFNENKIILAHRTLNFFPCNGKQETSLILPYTLRGRYWLKEINLGSKELFTPIA